MADVAAHDERVIEEDVFRLLWRDLMKVPLLVGIRFVPIETGAVIQWVSALFHHRHQYTIIIYVREVYTSLLTKDSLVQMGFPR